jgi:four helix bundle protein
MKYQRFEELPVWNDAVDLSAQIFAFAKDPELRRLGDAANQLERAGLSISNNIAEGFERGTTQELLTFIYYARGSAGEVRSILHVLNRVSALSHLQSEICNFRAKAESISRQLRAWAGTLQNSDVTGTRYMNEKNRDRQEARQKADAFMTKLKTLTPHLKSEI